MPKLNKMPTVIKFSAKCSDCFGAEFYDAENNAVAGYNGYVPDFFPEEHYGDYVQLNVDLKTGQILNWKAPSLAGINKTLQNNDGE